MPGLVLHVIPFLWSGAGGVVTRLCEVQAEKRAVAIVTTGVSGDMRDWPAYRRRLTRAGVTHHTIDFFHRDGAAFWSGVDALATLLRRIRPAIVHAHAGVWDLLVAHGVPTRRLVYLPWGLVGASAPWTSRSATS